MGRFGDLWASGKIIKREQAEQAARRVEDAVSAMEDLSPASALSGASAQILAALQSRRGQETGRWLKGMALGENAAPAPSSKVEPKSVADKRAIDMSNLPAFQATTAFVDALFKEFTELSYEFNKTAVGTELMLSCENASLREKKSNDVWYKPVVKSYMGRLTTRDFSLFVKGLDGKILITILPASLVLAYTMEEIDEKDYPPLMELTRTTVDGLQVFTLGGEVTPWEAIGALAKELLGDLVRVSSGVMSEAELFSGGAPKLGETAAVGFEAKSAGDTSSEAVARQHAPNLDGMDVFDACDVVDGLIERELKKLYKQASSMNPGKEGASELRLQISAMEKFRTKLLDAFEEYTHTVHSGTAGAPQKDAAGNGANLLV